MLGTGCLLVPYISNFFLTIYVDALYLNTMKHKKEVHAHLRECVHDG